MRARVPAPWVGRRLSPVVTSRLTGVALAVTAQPNPCASCHAKCCSNLLVTVKGHDVWRISRELHLPPEQFVAFLRASEPKVPSFKLDHGDDWWSMVLTKAPSRRKHRPCIFLVETPGGYRRCGIYALRPDVCRVYPLRHSRGVLGLRDDRLCPERSWNLASMDLAPWRTAFLRDALEDAIYGRVLERWNCFVDSSPAEVRLHPLVFIDYLINAYDRLQPMREALRPTWPSVLAYFGEVIRRGLSPWDRLGNGLSPTPEWALLAEGVEDALDPFLLAPQATGLDLTRKARLVTGAEAALPVVS